MAYTTFGRKMEPWEYDTVEFCKRGNISLESPLGKSIQRLSDGEIQRVSAVCDPAYNYLLEINLDDFLVDYGHYKKRYNF